MYDVVVIGGGPAGVQAAVSSVTEGLKTALVEADEVGGAIGCSPHLENLAGYVYGVPGGLFGRSMCDQLYRLGVKVIPERAVNLERGSGSVSLVYTDGNAGPIASRAVVIATGQRFANLNIEGTEAQCVHYGPKEAFNFGPDAEGKRIVVVGGGNSAGQTIEYLGKRAAETFVLTSKLKTSEYLTRQIKANDRVKVHSGRLFRIVDHGDQCEVIVDDATRYSGIDRVFICAGMTPNTEWLEGSGVTVDPDSGHVLTGGLTRTRFETTVQGVYAIGDCRAGAVGRVPAALGEGAAVQPELWDYLHGGTNA